MKQGSELPREKSLYLNLIYLYLWFALRLMTRLRVSSRYFWDETLF